MLSCASRAVPPHALGQPCFVSKVFRAGRVRYVTWGHGLPEVGLNKSGPAYSFARYSRRYVPSRSPSTGQWDPEHAEVHLRNVALRGLYRNRIEPQKGPSRVLDQMRLPNSNCGNHNRRLSHEGGALNIFIRVQVSALSSWYGTLLARRPISGTISGPLSRLVLRWRSSTWSPATSLHHSMCVSPPSLRDHGGLNPLKQSALIQAE